MVHTPPISFSLKRFSQITHKYVNLLVQKGPLRNNAASRSLLICPVELVHKIIHVHGSVQTNDTNPARQGTGSRNSTHFSQPNRSRSSTASASRIPAPPTDKKLLFPRPHVLDAARVREN
jgi:hypothetical protein